MRANKLFIIPLLFSPFVLTGCLGELTGIMCMIAPDSDHCYQWSGAQSGDASQCDKIKGTKFKDTGSNPPRDKCYLQVAQNTGNYEICKKIKGGLMSYTQQECLLGTALRLGDAAGCKKLKSFPSEYETCRSNLVTIAAVDKADKDIDELTEKIKKDPKNDKLKNDLEKARNRKNSSYDELSGNDKSTYFKEKREKIMADVEDGDVQKAISDTYTKYRSANPDMKVSDLLTKLQTIKEEQVQVKRLDDYANELTDKMKEQIQGVVDGKKDELIDTAGSKAKDWLQKNGGDNVKYGLKNLEWMRDKYEKGSEQYNKLQEKYDKLKGAYDKVMDVYNKVDSINTLVAQGKITEGQARAIKGGVFLQTGLEYTTKYVPVFGSTISKISKETFEMVINKAKERAARTNSLNKCIDDPEHCDTSGISGY